MSVTPREMVETLRRRAAVAKREAEARAAAARDKVIAVVAAELPVGARAWLIGSLAWGGYGERSDIDLVFEGVRGQPLFRIESALTKELRAEVDMLDFAELTPTFQARVEREGLPIHGR